jgi:HAD superfamily hydrolase (TIGR01662 family)
MTIASEIRTLIWDFDGTLIDSFEIYVGVLSEATAQSGVHMPARSVLLTNFHGSLEDSIKMALQLPDGTVFDTIMADFLEIQKTYYEHPNDHLFTDGLALVRRAHKAGLQQIIVSNRAHIDRGVASPRHLVENSELAGKIEYIVCGDEVEYRKPDARAIDIAVRDLDLDLNACLVIGDQFVDAQLAHNLGIDAVLVDRAGKGIAHLHTLHDDAQYIVVRSLDEVVL